jgi:hypothetical protein
MIVQGICMEAEEKQPAIDHQAEQDADKRPNVIYSHQPIALANYTLSSICPNCNAETHRRACKVICERCGFMWDCSEL